MLPAFLRTLAGVASLALTACTSTSILPISRIPQEMANPTTAADHIRIAEYFAQKATSYDAQAVWHVQKMAYNYSGRSRAEIGSSMISHCRNAAEHLRNAAKDARAFEAAHRQLANATQLRSG